MMNKKTNRSSLPAGSALVFVGGGKMGEAILGGWAACEQGLASSIGAQDMTVVEPDASRGSYLEERYGVRHVADAGCVTRADLVVLAVKPQVMLGVLAGLAELPAFAHALFVSIAAGMSTDSLVEALPNGSRLVRVMPNLPLLVGAGATTVCSSATSTDDDLELVCGLFACLGQAACIEEGLMDAASALSGSGPAYVAAMIECLAETGQKLGLPQGLTQELLVQTVYGSACLLKQTGQSPGELRAAVSSPGGSTLAALAAMEKAGIGQAYEQGVVAAVQRAKELGTCKA
ncbi:MAG: pyrroline-5-carboxylate reductase [Coriobacteriaceae bacterium]|jgi:pyrroline-5-carboxylate reductase|nr:pyrroline-5-carboxylate reductase [Coriobacteriaceae bacterium]